MEADFGEVILGHLEHIAGVGEEYIAPLFIDCHELVLAFFEGCKRFGIVALDPAGLVERYWFPTTLRAIFVEQTILYDFKLELSDSSDDLTAVELVDKQLCDTFVHQLLYALVKLLGLHWVGILYIFEHLRRETRKAFEMQSLTGSQRVADLEIAGIGDADDITGICLVDNILFLRHEGCRGSKFHGFA